MSQLALPGALICHVYEGDGFDFARAWRAVWRALPVAEKRRLKAYWRRIGPPRIELMSDWARRAPGVTGTTALLGRELRFHAGACACATEAEVQYTIAHELAHVRQWATGDMRRLSKTRSERDAYTRALAWLGLPRQPRRTPALSKWVRADNLRAMKEADESRQE